MTMEMTKQDQLSKYLEMREVLKEKFRLRYRNEAAVPAAEQTKKSNSGGSFFGPSAPSIAPRLLQPFSADNPKKEEINKNMKLEPKIKSPAASAASSNPEEKMNKAAVLESIYKPNKVVNPKPRETPNPEKKRVPVVDSIGKPYVVNPIPRETPNPEKKRVAVVDSIRKPNVVIPKPREPPKSVGNYKNLTLTRRTEIGKAAVIRKSSDHGDVRRPKLRRLVRRSDDSDSDSEEDEREGERALSIVRRMFNTSRFAGRDDRDFGAMESTFEEIGKEERRSAKLARKEDAEELRHLVLEEQRKRRRRDGCRRRRRGRRGNLQTVIE